MSNSNSQPFASRSANDDSQPIEWFHWSGCTSTDVQFPDLLEIKVLSTDTFKTKRSTAVTAGIRKGIEYVPHYISTKPASKKYGKFHKLWIDNVANGKIRPGVVFIVKTWLRDSETTSGRTVRDHEFVFKEEEARGQQQSASPSASLTKTTQQ